MHCFIEPKIFPIKGYNVNDSLYSCPISSCDTFSELGAPLTFFATFVVARQMAAPCELSRPPVHTNFHVKLFPKCQSQETRLNVRRARRQPNQLAFTARKSIKSVGLTAAEVAQNYLVFNLFRLAILPKFIVIQAERPHTALSSTNTKHFSTPDCVYFAVCTQTIDTREVSCGPGCG